MYRIVRADTNHLSNYGLHLKNLTDDDKISRFGFKVTDYAIDQLILNMLYNMEDHHLWAVEIDGEDWGWGHLARDGESWELAVSVAKSCQGLGYGNALIAEMLQWAKVHHVQEVYMHCIESNRVIQHLALKHNLKTRERGAGERTAAIEVPEPSFLDINGQRWKEHAEIMAEYAKLRQRLNDLWFNFK